MASVSGVVAGSAVIVLLLSGCVGSVSSGGESGPAADPGGSVGVSASPSVSASPVAAAVRDAAVALVQSYEGRLDDLRKSPPRENLGKQYARLTDLVVGTAAAPDVLGLKLLLSQDRRLEGAPVRWDWSVFEAGVTEDGRRRVLVEFCSDNRDVRVFDVASEKELGRPHEVLLHHSVVELTEKGDWAISEMREDLRSSCSKADMTGQITQADKSSPTTPAG